MRKTFSASVDAFAQKTKRRLRMVLQDSTFDLLEAAQTSQPSVKITGGSFEIGKIPVDESTLIRSLASELNGTGFGQPSEASFELVVALMQPGDIARFAWTAEHAMAIEMGWETSTGKQVGGRHFVGANAARWSEIVAGNARTAK